jgi:hypothetical protein
MSERAVELAPVEKEILAGDPRGADDRAALRDALIQPCFPPVAVSAEMMASRL